MFCLPPVLPDFIRQPPTPSGHCPTLHTGNSIQIRAPREKIFALVSDLDRWPELLPHYRRIQTLGTGEKGSIVHMAATRSGIPISWTSEYWTDERALELHFLHLRKWTKGMKVVWTLTPTRDGTRVEIIHDMKFRIPLLAWLAEPIISGFFIENIANKTLATFKAHLEQE
ncbi:MAG: SRPBCC family protein [Chthoniobacter sp.]|uniref:type II toxin-antitoxin system RatA family toxin n=1 Tax=Chthoniobacter sp. TaxID=2510640 RepID=UPI0032A92398